MKKIYTTIITMLAVATMASAQTTTITLRVDMSAAYLGEVANGICGQNQFDGTVDVVEAMGQDFNAWTGTENADCNGPYTPAPSVDFTETVAGSSIYERTFSLATIANPADMAFKFRINHSWDNDELRMVGDGNRHLDISTIGGIGGTYIVDAVFDVDGLITTVNSIDEFNANYSLNMAPNPVKSEAKFNFALVKNYNVSIKVFDLLGKEVKTIVSGDLNAGAYQYVWNADNNSGAKLTAGCYFYSLYLDNTKVKTDKIYIVK